MRSMQLQMFVYTHGVPSSSLSSSMLCRYISITKLPLADSITIGFLAPSLTAVAARIVLGEPAGPRTLVGCAASLLGVVIVTQPPMLVGIISGRPVDPWTPGKALGVAIALAGTVFSATSFIVIRSIGLCVCVAAWAGAHRRLAVVVAAQCSEQTAHD